METLFSDGWASGVRTKDGKEGLFPAAFVSLPTAPGDVRPTSPTGVLAAIPERMLKAYVEN